MEKMTKVLDVVRSILFWLGVVIASIVPLVLAAIKVEQPPWSMLVASGVLLMLATRFDVVEELSIGPLKAKLREQIKKTELTLAHLRRFTIPLAKSIATMTMAEGRWDGGTSLAERMQMKEELDGALKQLEVSEGEKEEVYRPWNGMLEFDHAHRIGNTSNLSRELIEKINLLHDFRTRRIAPAAEYERIIREANAMTPTIEEEIADLEHFQRTRTLRRPAVWN